MRTISHRNTISCHNQKTDTTAQVFCKLSMYVIPKTISCQNQKTNTTPQLYCTLDMQVSNTKTYSRHNQKTDTTAHLEKKVLQPVRSECIHSSVSHSVCPSVRAKRGIWSKRVFMRTNGNFSFSVR